LGLRKELFSTLALLPCAVLHAVVPSCGAGRLCGTATATLWGGWEEALLGLSSFLLPQNHKVFYSFFVKISESLQCANLSYETTQATELRFDFSVTKVSTSGLVYRENLEPVPKFTRDTLAGEGREEDLRLFHLISIPGLEAKFTGLCHLIYQLIRSTSRRKIKCFQSSLKQDFSLLQLGCIGICRQIHGKLFSHMLFVSSWGNSLD